MLTDLVAHFPNITVGEGYRRTSLPTDVYNCVAWAVHEDTRWWEPGVDYCFWPETPPRVVTVDTYIAMFKKHHGFKKCVDRSLEDELEKIAIYSKGKKFSHVARQLHDGRWTSKLGTLDDVIHTLAGLEGQTYGAPTIYMSRPILA